MTKGNTQQSAALRTQGRISVSNGLLRVREAARRDARARFTALLHHITIDLLRESFYALKRGAAPGVDGTTWKQYEETLEERLTDLKDRVHRGTYRAIQDSYYLLRRFFLPYAFFRGRPIGAGLGRCPTTVSILLMNRSDSKAWAEVVRVVIGCRPFSRAPAGSASRWGAPKRYGTGILAVE